MRMIDADALFETLVTGDIRETHQFCYPCKKVLEAIDAQPTVDPQPQWIPVTERLPDKDGRYLVTNSHWGAYEVDWNIFFNNQGWLWEQGVIAWMSLPEPYKGEQE